MASSRRKASGLELNAAVIGCRPSATQLNTCSGGLLNITRLIATLVSGRLQRNSTVLYTEQGDPDRESLQHLEFPFFKGCSRRPLALPARLPVGLVSNEEKQKWDGR